MAADSSALGAETSALAQVIGNQQLLAPISADRTVRSCTLPCTVCLRWSPTRPLVPEHWNVHHDALLQLQVVRVAQRDDFGRDAQHVVLPADPFAVGTDVAFRAAAKEVLATVEKKLLPLRSSLNQAQSDDHGGFLLLAAAPARGNGCNSIN